MESPLRAPEGIFAVLIFAAPARTGRQGAIDIALVAIFAFFIFAEGDYLRKPRNFAPRKNFPLYGIQWNIPVTCNASKEAELF